MCRGVPRKKAGKTGGWGSKIKGWDTYKGGIDFKGGGDHTPLHTMNYMHHTKIFAVKYEITSEKGITLISVEMGKIQQQISKTCLILTEPNISNGFEWI